MSAAGEGPVVQDVTFRVSADGALVGLDFACSDGRVRGVATPTNALPVLLAGLLWAGAEAAEKAGGSELAAETADRIQDGARMITGWRVTPTPDQRWVLLDLECGAAAFCVRLPRAWCEPIAEALARAGEPTLGRLHSIE